MTKEPWTSLDPQADAFNAELGQSQPEQIDRVTEILDGIPGAYERAQESIRQAGRGETIPLSDL